MGYRVAVPVWFDGNDHFVAGELIAVDSEAVVVGVVPKPAGYVTPPYVGPTVSTLFVKDKILGGLYLNMTLAQWQQTIAAVGDDNGGGGSSGVFEKTFNITTESNTITDAALAGATLLTISKGGIALDPVGMLSGSTITFSSNLEDGDVVVVLYSK